MEEMNDKCKNKKFQQTLTEWFRRIKHAPIFVIVLVGILYCSSLSLLFPPFINAKDFIGKKIDVSHHHKNKIKTAESVVGVERGKIISASITAQELYQAYAELRNEYNEIAFDSGSDSQWKIIKKTKDDIEISLLEHQLDASCPYVRMRATVDGSIEDVWGFLELKNWEKYMPKMDPFYEGKLITRLIINIIQKINLSL